MCYRGCVMVGGRCSCAISDRTTPSSAHKNPLSLLFPLDTRIPPVSPLFPLDTKLRWVHPPLWYDQTSHFGALSSPSCQCLLGKSSFLLLLATSHPPLATKFNHSHTSRRLARNPNYSRTYAKQG